VTRKIRLALIFGGQSAEHAVSLSSARSVLAAVDPARYEVVPIGISPTGAWLLGPAALDLAALSPVPDGAEANSLVIHTEGTSASAVARVLSPMGGGRDGDEKPIDVVFPLLHGPHGEDGTVQGLLELAGVPYVGAGVASSAVGMDKVLMKNLFLQAGLPVVPFLPLTRSQWCADPPDVVSRVAASPGYPCFVKPANMGSSIGVSRVDRADDLAGALDLACRYDRRLLVEKAVEAPREIECGVLGDDDPAVSVVGEIVVQDGATFYDYDAKYLPGASPLVVPASLPAETSAKVRALARRAFLAIDGAGMARVDFFLAADGALYLNEINTIPGFTPTSMFPRLWEASGVPYAALIDRLVALALSRHEVQHSLDTES